MSFFIRSLKNIHPFISIILPIQNEEKKISLVLDAIILQIDCPDKLEIIVCDGLSTDDTRNIINKYKKQHSFIYMIDNPFKFVSTGFNLGLSLAKGDIIIRIDGHCEIPPNYLENCIRLLKSKDADIVGGAIETISNGKIGKAIASAQSSFFGVGGVSFRNSNSQKPSYMDTLAFGAHKRKIFLEIGGYDEDMICNQDDEFNFRAIQSGKKIWMDPNIKTKYYSRSNFIQLFKQYYNYGFYKVRGIQKRQQIFSFRHLVPAVFVLGLILTFSIGYFLNNIWILFSIFIVYLIINIFSSIIISSNLYLAPLIFLSFWILHLGYGFGFIIGCFKFINKYRNNSLNDRHFNREKFLANTPV